MPNAVDYAPGSVKRHPEWPDEKYIAIRTMFNDTDYPGWTSWMRISPRGSEFVTPQLVEDWPDVEIAPVTEGP